MGFLWVLCFLLISQKNIQVTQNVSQGCVFNLCPSCVISGLVTCTQFIFIFSNHFLLLIVAVELEPVPGALGMRLEYIQDPKSTKDTIHTRIHNVRQFSIARSHVTCFWKGGGGEKNM